MIFYCQNDYEHVPYTNADRPTATIASSGCGVCSACMVVENLLGVSFPVEECARFAQACGARDGYGTDMEILGKALTEKFPLRQENTDSKERALEFLHNHEGMIIANPGGDREGHIGLFTKGGHYIVLAEACRNTVRILDPSLSPTKFDCEGRRGEVFVNGTDVYCDMDAVMDDCENRSPKFYMFSVLK